MISTGELRKGVVIELDGDLWQILDFHHIKMGRGSAQIRIKLRNVKRGQTVERTFQAGEKWPRAILDKRPVQFLYRDGDDFHFMENESYEQFHLTSEQLGLSEFDANTADGPWRMLSQLSASAISLSNKFLPDAGLTPRNLAEVVIGFLWNMVDLERIKWEGADALTPGKHTVEFDFKYEGIGSGTLAFNSFKKTITSL